MELLIAVLIAFGVISSDKADNLSQQEAEKLIVENKISDSDIKQQAEIIGLEESDM